MATVSTITKKSSRFVITDDLAGTILVTGMTSTSWPESPFNVAPTIAEFKYVTSNVPTSWIVGGNANYGTFIISDVSIDPLNPPFTEWTYTLNYNNPTIQTMGLSDILYDTFAVITNTGTAQLVTVVIYGSDDPRLNTSPIPINLALAGTILGSIVNIHSFSYPWHAGHPVSPPDFPKLDVIEKKQSLYGAYEINALSKTWTYTLDHINPFCAPPWSDPSTLLTDQFTILSTTGDARTVTLTISPATGPENYRKIVSAIESQLAVATDTGAIIDATHSVDNFVTIDNETFKTGIVDDNNQKITNGFLSNYIKGKLIGNSIVAWSGSYSAEIHSHTLQAALDFCGSVTDYIYGIQDIIAQVDARLSSIRDDIHAIRVLASDKEVGIALNTAPDMTLHSMQRAVTINSLKKSDNLAAVSAEMTSPTAMP
jgi:VCBS repeat-containing protein